MLVYARKFTYLSAAKNSNKEYLTSGMANLHKNREILHRQDKKQDRSLVFRPLLRALCHKFTILEEKIKSYGQKSNSRRP